MNLESSAVPCTGRVTPTLPRLVVPRLLVPRLVVPRLLVPRLLVPRLLVACLLLPCLLLLAPGISAADEAEDRAQQHNVVAKKLFNLGLFPQAAEEYLKAYKAKPVPAFLFNLAQCYKRMTTADNLEKAIFYYKSYLHNDPRAPFREQIEREIVKLGREVDQLRRSSPFYKQWWFWTAVGVVVTGAAVGTALALQPEDQQPVMGTAPPGLYSGI